MNGDQADMLTAEGTALVPVREQRVDFNGDSIPVAQTPDGTPYDVAGRQDLMADYLRGFIVDTHQRLAALERATATDATISEAQAAEIALAVKAVGQRLESRGDREGYAKVYAALYRRYSISTYKALPAARFAEVRDWLHDWYGELTNEG